MQRYKDKMEGKLEETRINVKYGEELIWVFLIEVEIPG